MLCVINLSLLYLLETTDHFYREVVYTDRYDVRNEWIESDEAMRWSSYFLKLTVPKKG